MGIIDKLKEARKNAGMTQEDVELESKGKIRKRTISNWENGVSRPDIDSVALLCKIYKIDPNGLFEWEKENPELIAENKKEGWTDAEKVEIENFKKYMLSKRSK